MEQLYKRVNEVRATGEYSGLLITKDGIEIKTKDNITIKENVSSMKFSYERFMSEFAGLKNNTTLDIVQVSDMRIVGIKETEVIIIRFRSDIEC